ncbi:MAG: 30S ribosomal protein S20 [Rhodospirillaceae bacterium]|jgi:small subunit ribosomal protein S20|nr:30S ribosomal protein S20 [Rhodospirillaceae bacterium]MBT6118624.1 30S ribosomal protein S20 [Rhodospirillaceae bacterium]
MAHHQSAKKRIRRNARQTVVNGDRRGRVRTSIKNVELAIQGGDKAEAAAALRTAQPVIQSGVGGGVLHANTAARKLSRLSKRIKAL